MPYKPLTMLMGNMMLALTMSDMTRNLSKCDPFCSWYSRTLYIIFYIYFGFDDKKIWHEFFWSASFFVTWSNNRETRRSSTDPTQRSRCTHLPDSTGGPDRSDWISSSSCSHTLYSKMRSSAIILFLFLKHKFSYILL